MAVELIAELAQGYEGRPDLARRLVLNALTANADAVKLQLVLADELATPSHPRYEWYRSLEMEQSVWTELASSVHDAGRRLYFDVFGPTSLATAAQIGADGVKIHASDFHNRELIGRAVESFPRVYVSIGGIRADEVSALVEDHDFGADSPIRLLYGFQSFPTAVSDNNLHRFQQLILTFPDVWFGFMDHSDGRSAAAWHIPLMAVAVGAVTLEKHMTLERELDLVDSASALTPEELSQFVKVLRELEPALGSASTELSESEEAYRRKALKVVVAANHLPAGHVIVPADVMLKRSPEDPRGLLHRPQEATGRRLTIDVDTDRPISAEDLSCGD
ncbi:MAG: N-acetylneuraminate synthase family protein [Coriobacteriia bacterium]|nr:N-acetylneuraminate synthase family protein [Coriobacteriia bacterium]